MSDIQLKFLDQTIEEDVVFLYETRRHSEIVPFLFGEPPESLALHKAWLKDNVPSERLLFILKVDGKSVGYCQAYNFEGNTVEVGFVVHPNWQGNGYGSKMVDLLVEEIKRRMPEKKIVLEVKANNLMAIGLYQRHGFVKNSIHMEME